MDLLHSAGATVKIALWVISISIVGSVWSPSGKCSQNLSGELRSLPSYESVQVVKGAKRNGRSYQIRYNLAKTRIELAVDGRQVILNKIPKSYDPSIVGSDAFIGFLPDKLQIYKAAGFLVYVSAKRTSGGSGGGQCGSGSEIYLNFLDTGAAIPKVRSRILVGSCDESIELAGQSIQDRVLGDIEVTEGRLRLRFLNYKQMEGSPTATISSDLKALIFGDEDIQKQKRRHDHS